MREHLEFRSAKHPSFRNIPALVCSSGWNTESTRPGSAKGSLPTVASDRIK
jgi:hypothetical protein